MDIKTPLKNISVLNTLLFIIAFLFAAYIFLPTLNTKVIVTLPGAGKQAEKTAEETQGIRIPSQADYVKISEENLFHPERKIPLPAEKAAEKQLPKPDFVLYGTVITDELSLAYVEDLKAPRNTPGRGKRQTALKKGDSISGFTVKDIEPENIVLTRGEETVTLKVAEGKKERSVQITPHPKEPSAPPQPPARPRDTIKKPAK